MVHREHRAFNRNGCALKALSIDGNDRTPAFRFGEQFRHRDPTQEFADRILSELEKGVRPWVRHGDADKATGDSLASGPSGIETRAECLHKGAAGAVVLAEDMRRPEQALMPVLERERSI